MNYISLVFWLFTNCFLSWIFTTAWQFYVPNCWSAVTTKKHHDQHVCMKDALKSNFTTGYLQRTNKLTFVQDFNRFKVNSQCSFQTDESLPIFLLFRRCCKLYFAQWSPVMFLISAIIPTCNYPLNNQVLIWYFSMKTFHPFSFPVQISLSFLFCKFLLT